LVGESQFTSRFVVIDNYEIAGAGIILEDLVSYESTLKAHVQDREFAWISSAITAEERRKSYGHGSKLVVFTGDEDDSTKEVLATTLEKRLFDQGVKVYYLRSTHLMRGLEADITHQDELREGHVRRLGELARILTDSGQIFITSISNVDDYDLQTLEWLNKPNEIVVINVGENRFNDYRVNLNHNTSTDIDEGIERICDLLKDKKVILDYCI